MKGGGGPGGSLCPPPTFAGLRVADTRSSCAAQRGYACATHLLGRPAAGLAGRRLGHGARRTGAYVYVDI